MAQPGMHEHIAYKLPGIKLGAFNGKKGRKSLENRPNSGRPAGNKHHKVYDQQVFYSGWENREFCVGPVVIGLVIQERKLMVIDYCVSQTLAYNFCESGYKYKLYTTLLQALEKI
jgi:hypothetical protein